MGLPWVRLDSSIASHDKMLRLTGDPSAQRWQAAASYMFALGWSGLQGTDGRIPREALPFVHGTAKTARLLVKHGLWIEQNRMPNRMSKPGSDHEISSVSSLAGPVIGYLIANYGDRQQLSVVSDAKTLAARTGALKANCVRWHGDSCWKAGKCSKVDAA